MSYSGHLLILSCLRFSIFLISRKFTRIRPVLFLFAFLAGWRLFSSPSHSVSLGPGPILYEPSCLQIQLVDRLGNKLLHTVQTEPIRPIKSKYPNLLYDMELKLRVIPLHIITFSPVRNLTHGFMSCVSIFFLLYIDHQLWIVYVFHYFDSSILEIVIQISGKH